MSNLEAPEAKVIEVNLAFHQRMEAPTYNFMSYILAMPQFDIIMHCLYMAVAIIRKTTNMPKEVFIENVDRFWEALEPPPDKPC